MRRLAWAVAGRLSDKYHNLMSWLILWGWSLSLSKNDISPSNSLQNIKGKITTWPWNIGHWPTYTDWGQSLKLCNTDPITLMWHSSMKLSRYKAKSLYCETRGSMVLYRSCEIKFHSEWPWTKIKKMTLTSCTCISPCTHLAYYISIFIVK